MAVPMNLVIGLGVGALAVAAGCGAIAMVSAREASARQRRMDTYVRRPDRKDSPRERRHEIKRKQIDSKLKTLNERQKHAKSRLGAVKGNLVRAGIDMPVTQFWLVCMLLGLLASGLWSFSRTMPIATPAVFVAFTFLVPRLYLGMRAGKRQAEFTKHFASAVDVLVRGLKSGLPVNESLRVIGKEIPDPVGSEFRIVIDEVNAGLTMQDALERAYDRMPTQELRFFATIISVQAQTGGNLAEILSNIAKVLRDRAQLREKAKALSGEARMSSIIVGALPFVVSGVLYLANREYISLLWQTSAGNMILAGACFMMFMGVFIMNRMGKLDV